MAVISELHVCFWRSVLWRRRGSNPRTYQNLQPSTNAIHKDTKKLVRQESNLQGLSAPDLQSSPLPPTELLTNVEEEVRFELTPQCYPRTSGFQDRADANFG